MIFYLATKRFQHVIREFLDSWGTELSSLITPLGYEDLFKKRTIVAAGYIFSDLERLSSDQLERAALLWTGLAQAVGPEHLFNHPTRSMRRYELLRSLYERGLNQFNVYRITEARRPQRFPVFLRREDDHGGSKTPLLASPQDLDRAVEAMLQQGIDRDRILIAEFCDTADANGIYRKYSSFIVGDQIIPRHLFFSRNWMVKGPSLAEEEMAREEWEYVALNPHEQTLKAVFALARVRYGRIDYSVVNGNLQVWEINTNPWIMSLRDGGGPRRMTTHQHFYNEIKNALRILDLEPQPKSRTKNPAYRSPTATRIAEISRETTRKAIRSILRRLGLLKYQHSVHETLRGLLRLFVRSY